MAITFAEKVLYGIKADSCYLTGERKPSAEEKRLSEKKQEEVDRCLNCPIKKCKGTCDFFKR